jgi:hypothetical protein
MAMTVTGKLHSATVKLFWLPLGAGGRSVRWNGRLFEWLAAWRDGRVPRTLYHSALEVRIGVDRHVIEMAPAWAALGERGVVKVGPVAARCLGSCPLFRYEIRRWRDGRISDIAEAVNSPQSVGGSLARAERLLELVPYVPGCTWGRDEVGAGDMWNSNSVVSWLLARSGHDVHNIMPPAFGRAPGWRAGLVLAARQARTEVTVAEVRDGHC